MSSLDLKMEVPTDTFCERLFPILRGFLQPDTTTTLELTANSILDLLPENHPHSSDVLSFGELCIELVEQIPYHHPSQLKLAGLVEYLGMSTKLGQIMNLKVEMPLGSQHSGIDQHIDESQGMNTSRFHRYQRLGESLRDSLMGGSRNVPFLDASGVRGYYAAS